MNTFEKYLLYYVGLLLLPILVMSCVFSHVMTDFCTKQLTEQNLSAIKQLSVTIEIQREQMDAYAVQTTTRSEFFARNQTTAGDINSIQRILKQWMLAGSFVDDVFYYNTKLGRVYCYNAVYSLHDFVQLRMGNHVITEDELKAILDSGVSNMWLHSDSDAEKLYYLSSARISQKERAWLIFQISPTVMRTVTTNSKLYDSADISIIDEDGQVLCHHGSYLLQPFYDSPAEQGTLKTADGQMVYAKSSEYNLTYMSIVPKNAILSPLNQLWHLFFSAILITNLFGALIIFCAMKMNYRPIKDLENAVLESQVLDQPTNDAIVNVSQAFSKIQQSNKAMTSIAKERVIFRLLLGSYQTFDAFNQEGKPVRLHLNEGHLYIINVRNCDDVDDDLAPLILQQVRKLWQDQRTVMFVEIPENQDVILVVSGDPSEGEAERLTALLDARELHANVRISEVCEDPAQLAGAWLSLSDARALGDSCSNGNLTQEQIHMLTNALDFGEPDRIQFVISSIISALNGMADQDLRLPLIDLVYSVRLKCSDRYETINALDTVLTDIREMGVHDLQQAVAILQQVGQVLCADMIPPDDDGDPVSPLCQQITAYLGENYTNSELNVQYVADYFHISLSNLSHYFKSHTGLTVSTYIESLRLTHGQELLKTTDLSINEIAQAVGYAQPATFMRAFKKLTGISPTNWRNQNRD